MPNPEPTLPDTHGPIAVGLHRNLRRAGLEGYHMLAELRGDTLLLRGEKRGVVTIPVASIERLRVGYIESKVITYETLLWRIGHPDPVCLTPLRPLCDPLDYAALVRVLAARVAGQRGLQAIETGSSPAFWLTMFLLMAALLALALFLAIFVIPGEPGGPWWGGLFVVVFPLFIAGLIAWRWRAVHRPRPVPHLAVLDHHLPR